MMTDPISDMLTRMRNAMQMGHKTVLIPYSKLKEQIAKKVKDTGYISGVDVIGEGIRRQLSLELRYGSKKHPVIRGIRRVSKPGKRVYISAKDIKSAKGAFRMSILSTPLGILADSEAKHKNVGGEIICTIW